MIDYLLFFARSSRVTWLRAAADWTVVADRCLVVEEDEGAAEAAIVSGTSQPLPAAPHGRRTHSQPHRGWYNICI